MVEKITKSYEKHFHIIVLLLLVMITKLGIMPLRGLEETSVILKLSLEFIYKILHILYDYRHIFQLIILVLSVIYVYLKGNKKNKIIVGLIVLGSALTFINSISYKQLYFISLEIRHAVLFPLFFVFLNVFEIFWRKKGAKFLEELVFKTIKLATIYVALVFVLGKVTNLYCITYQHPPYGYSARFLERNAISHFLVMLLPLLMYFFYKRKEYRTLLYILTVIICALSIGTKSTYFGVFASLILYLIVSLIRYIKRREVDLKKVISIFVIFVFLLNINNELYATQFINRSINYSKVIVEVDEKITSDEIITTTEEKIDVTKLVLKGRDFTLKEMKWVYNHQKPYTKIFGLGFYYPKYYFVMVEMDFFDILFKQGIFGMTAYLSAVIYSIALFFKNIRENKKKLKLEELLFPISAVAMATVASVVAGHVMYNGATMALYSLTIMFLLSKTEN